MTVKRLRQILAGYDEESEVMFAYDYGDHGHTLVASPVGYVEDATVTRSEYHRMDKVVYEPEGAEGEREVVLLTGDPDGE